MFARDGESRERGRQRVALGMRRGGNGEISTVRRERAKGRSELVQGWRLEMCQMPAGAGHSLARCWALQFQPAREGLK